MAQQNSVVTNVGLNLQAAKAASGEAVVFTHIVLGNGSRIPAGGESTLENETYRAQITNSGVEAAQLNTAFFEIYVPAEVNTFSVQEIGLVAEDGTLYALTHTETPIIKYGPDSTTLSSYTFRILVTFSDLENVVVQMSPIGAIMGDTLPNFMPWATTVEANNPATTNRIIQINDLHNILGGLVPDFPFSSEAEFNNSTPDKIAQIAQVKSYIATELANALAANSANQVGNFLIAAGTVPTAGTFECNGAALLRIDYPLLFARIGTVFGEPDGDSFSLPDMRGVVPRGWDNGRGLDPARVFGSYQEDSFKSHFHVSGPRLEWAERYSASGVTNIGENPSNDGGDHEYVTPYNSPNTSTVGDTETRGKNVAVMFCIIHD